MVRRGRCYFNTKTMHAVERKAKALLVAWIERSCAIAEDHDAVKLLQE